MVQKIGLGIKDLLSDKRREDERLRDILEAIEAIDRYTIQGEIARANVAGL